VIYVFRVVFIRIAQVDNKFGQLEFLEELGQSLDDAGSEGPVLFVVMKSIFSEQYFLEFFLVGDVFKN